MLRPDRASTMERCLDDIEDAKALRNVFILIWMMAGLVGVYCLKLDEFKLIPIGLIIISGAALLWTSVMIPLCVVYIWIKKYWYSQMRKEARDAGDYVITPASKPEPATP